MQLVEGRRLTGPSLWLDQAGAAVEVVFEQGDNAEAEFDLWCGRLRAVLAGWGWTPDFGCRTHAGSASVRAGATWAMTAPVDALHVAVDAVEWAVHGGDEALRRRVLVDAMQRHAHPALVALASWAAAEDVPLLWDDDEVSLGLGAHARVWPMDALPDPRDLHAEPLRHRLPIAMVTGTNGKTTTARWLARAFREAGLVVGATSTDGLDLDGVRVLDGDWTGPGGARQILRNVRVQAAVLEAARGGLLRRGVGTIDAAVAVVTNISDDHLGEWGIVDLEGMAEAKLSVRKALRPDGVLVLNAQDAALRAAVERLQLDPARLAWFARDVGALADVPGGWQAAAWLRDGSVVVQHRGGQPEPLLNVAEIPLTYGGTAQHNVDNALAVVLASEAAGLLERAALLRALRGFRPTAHDNPGRGNLFHFRGGQLLVDFAHNPDSVRHLAGMVAHWPNKRRLLLIGQAGDRDDHLMRELVRAALALQPDRIFIKDVLHYLRGRQPGEVPALLRDLFVAEGFPLSAIGLHPEELTALHAVLAEIREGDLGVLLIHDDFAAAVAALTVAGAVAA
jgi:UDP-N-acetylmuramyl tripeptide synthase